MKYLWNINRSYSKVKIRSYLVGGVDMNSKKRLSIVGIILLFVFTLISLSIYFHLNQKDNGKQANTTNPVEVKKPKPIKEVKPEEKEEEEIVIEEAKMITKQLTLSQSIQENNYFCVPACVQMIFRYHNIEVSQTQLAKEMHTHPITGSEYVDTANVLNKYLFHKTDIKDNEPGYRIQTIAINDQNPQIMQDLEKRVIMDIETGDPLLVAINRFVIYPNLSKANHMILVVGYDMLDHKIQSYHIIDPSHLVQDGTKKGLKTIDVETLRQAIIQNEEPAYIW